MASLPQSELQRVALYARVSSDDQAERGTVQAQLQFVRSYCDLYGLSVVGLYVDDGWSGTIPLADRPDGGRLLGDAQARRFDAVLVYRLDRLARSLKALMDAHDALDGAGVAIKSCSEPFDTSTPFGRAMFQFLGIVSELERSTITERMSLGRDRVARAGKWTGGPVPFGYDLDDGGCLVLSARLVDGVEMTEAELARSVFDRIAEGSTLIAETRRLSAVGIRGGRRYGRGPTIMTARPWTPSRLGKMLKNSVYKGLHVLNSRHGAIERPVPALVDVATWEAARAQLGRNRKLATRNAKRRYLLRGLIRCGMCGIGYTGAPGGPAAKDGRVLHYYRCASYAASTRPGADGRCRSKMLRADWLEERVWEDCRAFILDPGEALAEARAQLRERLSKSAELDGERHRLERLLADKEAERERAMTLFRRGRVTLEDVERQIDDVNREAAELRGHLDVLRAQADLAQAFEAHYAEAATLLGRLRDRLEEVELVTTGRPSGGSWSSSCRPSGSRPRARGGGRQRASPSPIRSPRLV